MLVLSRRLNERIFIGKNNEIIIKVVKSKKNKVLLGVEAPREVPVFREEVLEKITNEEVSD